MTIVTIIQKCVRWYDAFIDFIVKYIRDMFLLILRLYIASIFFQSGWNKFENLWEGGWFKTVFLFKNVYKVPLISPEIAAVMGTGAELIFSIFLALGILSRVGALGLLGVTAVITFGVHSHFTHEFWALLLGVSLIIGPGQFSFDSWLRSWWTQLHATVHLHLESAEVHSKVDPKIVCKDRPNEKIMLDNKKEPIVKIRLSKRKLISEPDKIVTVKSLIKKPVRQSREQVDLKSAKRARQQN
ncbi:MAG: DoxX family protein [Alphaproteobacteria bacterium]|nr:DoxX family protein [Alphaproteobacteria bacterium]